jgi:hypothetical protein
MKRLIYLIVLFALLSCNSNSGELKNSKKINAKGLVFNFESAQKVLEIASVLSEGNTIEQRDWKELFNSAGYRHYLVYSDSTRKKELIKEAMVTAFLPTNKKVLDSLLQIPITLDVNYLKLSLTKNFDELKRNLASAKDFLKKTNFEQILADADSLAKTFLPISVQDSLPELYPVYAIASNPDGAVINNSICLDLNLMLQMGKEGLIKFIAHEYHHNYRKLNTKDFDNALMVELNKSHQEGLADLIDKEKPPLSKSVLFPQSILQIYNDDYQRTPENLRVLDSLVVGYIHNRIDSATYHKMIRNYFKFGGHTSGIYISFLIEEKAGKASLIESYNNPVAFIYIYNRIASNLPDEYVFSQDFLNYINQYK